MNTPEDARPCDCPLFVGATFAERETIKVELAKLASGYYGGPQFTSRTERSETRRYIVSCSAKLHACPCPFKLRAIPSGEGWKISVLELNHTCFADAHPVRNPLSIHKFLDYEVPKLLTVTIDTTAAVISDVIGKKFGQTIPSKAALRCKHRILRRRAEEQTQQFPFIPHYIDALKQQSPGVYTHLSFIPALEHPDVHFHRVFVCPAASVASYRHVRHFVAIDGTFMNFLFKETLLIAATVDADGGHLPLAWAIVESENNSSWSYFLRHLQLAIPDISSLTIMIDRHKSIIASLRNTLPNAL
ncbi:MAG: transposase, partial [Paenibacillus sp.]|uniref:transposase n=1 Tax=Paenibacillus sp. TaxID=58172 RepID=UPI003B76476C